MQKTIIGFLILVSSIAFSQTHLPLRTSSVTCNLVYKSTIGGFDTYMHIPSNATLYRAKFAVDADGSPRAYGPSNSGLDWTANAGYPGNWWGIVTDASGNPIIQGSSDPHPGMYVSTTSLVNSAYGTNNPLRYVNSETVPYFAIPSALKTQGGIRIGDVAYVYNTVTGLGCFAIYADTGPAGALGEGSMYLATQLGLNNSPKTGGTSSGIIDYVIFPMSGFGQGKIPSIAQIDSMGNAWVATVGGTGIHNCLNSPSTVDNIAPTTSISTPSLWDTTTFVATFTDNDNTGGTGVEKSFYQVADFNGVEWRANAGRGFFQDDFNGPTIHSDWTSKSGLWSIATGSVLQQTDETNSNTNLYAALTQTTISNRFLYHWTGTMSGSGTNRRAGFHFFCDQPDSSNRGNSYFVFFRLDNDKIQLYKVVNNSWGTGPVLDSIYNFNVNQAYDYKVSYDRITGKIKIYVDNVLSAEWTDSSPINTGTHVSFRSANCIYQVDNFKVYRSRNATATIYVGSGSTNYVRYQNPNPSTPSGKIRTIITDGAGNLSSVVVKDLNIDWTNPFPVTTLNDGVGADIDTTTNGTQLQANWSTATDVNSGINKYYYAIGTSTGASNIISWTSISSPTNSITVSGLSLINGQKYYVSIQSENFAGMRSSVVTSDGQIYSNGVATALQDESIIAELLIYPNPNNGEFVVQSNLRNEKVEFQIVDVFGKIVLKKELNAGITSIDLTSQANGVYYLLMTSHGDQIAKKIVVNH